MLYPDTSLLVSAFTNESETRRMQQWLEEQSPDELSISDWVLTEFSSALSIKLRTGQLDEGERAASLAMLIRVAAESFNVVPVSREQFRLAARFADHYALGLRAGDALHAAICADYGAVLCTLDRRLSEAGGALGVRTILL
jgi:uncharacterized protein